MQWIDIAAIASIPVFYIIVIWFLISLRRQLRALHSKVDSLDAKLFHLALTMATMKEQPKAIEYKEPEKRRGPGRPKKIRPE